MWDFFFPESIVRTIVHAQESTLLTEFLPPSCSPMFVLSTLIFEVTHFISTTRAVFASLVTYSKLPSNYLLFDFLPTPQCILIKQKLSCYCSRASFPCTFPYVRVAGPARPLPRSKPSIPSAMFTHFQCLQLALLWALCLCYLILQNTVIFQRLCHWVKSLKASKTFCIRQNEHFFRVMPIS